MKRALNKKQRAGLFELAREFGVTLRFVVFRSEIWANVGQRSRLVQIDKRLCYSDALSAFFHELGHLHCHANGIYPAFHKSYFRSWAEVRAMRRTALRAERFVDRWAEREFRKRIHGGLFCRSYVTKADKKVLRDYCLTFKPGTSRG